MENPRELISLGWKREQDGSPMCRCAQKLQQIRHDLFGWCKEFRMTNNITWDEAVDKYVKV